MKLARHSINIKKIIYITFFIVLLVIHKNKKISHFLYQKTKNKKCVNFMSLIGISFLKYKKTINIITFRNRVSFEFY